MTKSARRSLPVSRSNQSAAMKIDHVTIASSSLDSSLRYYGALLPLLGFHEVKEGIWSDGDGFAFQFMEAAPNSRPYERYAAGLNHLGFSARDAEQVESIRGRMKEAGFDVPDIQDLDGARALFLRDPDGIRFEVTYYPPGAAVVDG